ncbi:WecB/TagA/CpsF family glycosyltransferase [Colwellia sp. RSH04]|uniref:WecB/TagA/CpsF family glycosyltransferase n=1 Tax=Colwellia sp. RSH04 TaxID=2305464 RepID=UPI000E57C809|nr:WecB/TagA/CpsF family glycosyltransferase [Colwellia sp. RSH04]RHW74902.1 WecB/TagA/CpsF family glycosyltransferase [Colwellia sp. RSH04]
MKNHSVKPVDIAGIPVKPFKSFEHVLESVFDQDDVIPGAAIAINPEKILQSLESEEVRKILLDATIRYADGIGVVKVMEKKTGEKLSRIAGAELWLEIIKKAAKSNTSVFLLGSKPEVIEACQQKLVSETGVTIAGVSDGYFKDKDKLINTIQQSNAGIVIVALGSPKQELFIKECIKTHPNAFYMGVGGSFDVYVGNVKRAPQFWINLNLEWFYRLMSEPKRFFRQLRLFKFVYLHLTNKL